MHFGGLKKPSPRIASRRKLVLGEHLVNKGRSKLREPTFGNGLGFGPEGYTCAKVNVWFRYPVGRFQVSTDARLGLPGGAWVARSGCDDGS